MSKRHQTIVGLCIVMLTVISNVIHPTQAGAMEPFAFSSDPLFPLVCTEPLMRGLPDFSKQPKGTAKYRFGGTCISPDRAVGQQMTYRLEGSWNPAETDPQKPNASESVEFTGYEPFLPDRAPGGRIYMYWTARCNKDPWLDPTANCTRTGAYIPDDLGVNVPDLQATSFPRTGNIISPGDKNRLLAEYQRINPPGIAKPLDRLGGAATARVEPPKTGVTSKPLPSTTVMALPKIIKPASGAQIVQGQLVVQVDPIGAAGSSVMELKFEWLDTPPDRTRFVNRFFVDTGKLLKGYLVDQAVTRGQTGRWEVRTRVSGKSTTGDWSLPAPFQLMLTPPQPAQAQSKPPSSTPFIQKPQEGSQPGTQIFLPPAQGGNQLFRSRGIDKKEGEAPAPDAEKKP